MKLYKTEKENQNHLIGELKKSLSNFLDETKLLGTEVPVPYQHIYLPGANLNSLEVWCFNQDICLYRPLIDKTVKYKNALVVDNEKKQSLLNVVLANVGSKKDSPPVGLPYVIIETKTSITTHDLLTYTSKMEKIKTIFPYVQYALLSFGKLPPRAYRLGAMFDKIMYIDEFTPEKIKTIATYLRDGYKTAKETMEKISKEQN